MEKARSFRRGAYDEIMLYTMAAKDRDAVTALVNAAANGRHVDEHGAWEFGAEFDNKGRGSALNWALYGIGYDCHGRKAPKRLLAVVQVRQYVKHRKNDRWPQIRKSYFILGRNEDKTVFAHPVQAAVVRAAVNKERDVVKTVQDWLWGADYAGVTRQGDIALVPRRTRPPKVEPMYGPVVIAGSHLVLADETVSDGKRIYARNARLVHLPGTHPEVTASGWVAVTPAKRAATWDFAAPTVD